jgi:hypothetical protein
MGKSFNTGKLVNNLNVLDNGNVGIGTSSFSPWAAGTLVLRVQQTSGLSVIQAVSGDGGSGICLYSGASSSDNPAIISLKDIRFGTATDLGTGGFNERMRITSTGNVGIGTSSPNTILDVNGTINVRTNGFEFGRITTNNVTGNIGGLTFQYNASGTFTEAMRITGGGNVGIGTSNPQSYTNYRILHIAGSATNGSGLLYLTNSNNSIVGLAYAEGSLSRVTFGSQSNHDVTFVSNDTERMRISSSGTLSINGPRFIQQGLSRLCYAGTILGNQSITITLNAGSQSALKITAAMNHYGLIDGYGCARMSWVGVNPAFSEINISNVSSGNGGSWSFTHVGGGTINIIKNAGSYGGGGYFFVEVIGNDPISIA